MARKNTIPPKTYNQIYGHIGVPRPQLEYTNKLEGIEEWVLPGWVPQSPLLTKTDRIVTFGSCFACRIMESLGNAGYNVTPGIRQEERCLYFWENGYRFVSSGLIRQHFEWAWENGPAPIKSKWMTQEAQDADPEHVRQLTCKVFSEAKAFILTYGMSEVWVDNATGQLTWGVPRGPEEKERVHFAIRSVAETKQDLHRIVDLIRKYNPGAIIIFTLSPIPLNHTFRDISALTSNSASKAILRAALDEVFRERESDERFFYWPAYEVMTEMALENKWQSDGWHFNMFYLDRIVALFHKYFLLP